MTDPAETNRAFYDGLWREARMTRPERFNTWPVVTGLAARAPRRLEVGPGLRPRLPLEGTLFVDASKPAVARLRGEGGNALIADAAALPLPDQSFSLVATFDLVEHHPDDSAVVREVARVLDRHGRWLLAVPLHASAWTPFDDFVGHYRRYDPPALHALLAEHGFEIEQSAVFGMQPKSTRLLSFGMWMMTHSRRRAMRWYNHVFVPLALRFQRPLEFRDGFTESTSVDEVVLVCRRRART